MGADGLVLGTLLGALLLLRVLRVREQRAHRRQVVWIAQGHEVGRLLATLAGDYRLTRQEVRDTRLAGGLLVLVLSVAIGRLLSVWHRGPGAGALADFGRMLSFAPAIAAGGVILGAGLLVTHWRTRATHRIQPEYLEEYSGAPFGSWRLDGAEITRVGRQHSGRGALLLETKGGILRAVRVGEALAEALSSTSASFLGETSEPQNK